MSIFYLSTGLPVLHQKPFLFSRNVATFLFSTKKYSFSSPSVSCTLANDFFVCEVGKEETCNNVA